MINFRSEAREGAAHSPISVATHSSDEILPIALATLRELIRKPKVGHMSNTYGKTLLS